MANNEQYTLKPALCLDLDGTVRYSSNPKSKFIETPWDVELYYGVEEVIWKWRDDGYHIIGVTNQGGVAWGIKRVLDHAKINKAMLDLFERNPFHMIKVSFNDPKGRIEPYCHRSLLRKPDYGMLAICEVEALSSGIVIDWDNSLFVGDRPEDKECADKAGIRFKWEWDFFDREPPPSYD